MAMAVYMQFRSMLLHLIVARFLLLLVIGVSAQDNSSRYAIGKCGLNGFFDNSFNCTCPPGFHFMDNGNQSKGCLPNISQELSCNASSAEMHELERINWMGNDYALMIDMNKNACKQACMEDCFCTVVIFNGVDSCYKKALPLKNGVWDELGTAFFKVYSALPPTQTKQRKKEQGIPPTQTKQRKKEQGTTLVIIGIILVGFSIVFAVVFLFIWFVLCRPKLKFMQEEDKYNSEGLKVYSYEELDAAAGGFKEQIGRGGFGKVYKGSISDGKTIAVKELDRLVKDDHGEKQFRTEMKTIGLCHHKNLVQLYGFCNQGFHKLLVYEYMPNGSLDRFLFEARNYLDWDLRVQVALGIARGLLYLHEECTTHILHCDIKPQNILLDANYIAKISDFGMAKLIGAEQTRTFTLARGTLGYMAPEWKKSMAVTAKVDVYSFGVMLLEIICCRKMFELDVPENEMVLSDWVYDCFRHGRLVKLVEEQQCRGMEPRQLERMVLVGLWCIQEDPTLRPTMKKVVQMLEGTVEIAVPPNPGSS